MTARVRWTGEIDLTTVEAFGTAVKEAVSDGGDLCIDLRDATFIDSTGISRLIRAARSVSERGFAVTVLTDQPMMRRAFALLHADDAMTIEPALSAVDSAPASDAPRVERI